MESEIMNYANEMRSINLKLIEDSYFVNAAIHTLGFPPVAEKPMESLVRIGQLGVAFVEGINRNKARQKEIAEFVPPIDAESPHTKLLKAVQTKQQALEEYVTYTYMLLEVGVGESSFLQRANDLWRESNQLLEEANAELLKLYEKVGK